MTADVRGGKAVGGHRRSLLPVDTLWGLHFSFLALATTSSLTVRQTCSATHPGRELGKMADGGWSTIESDEVCLVESLVSRMSMVADLRTGRLHFSD